MLTSHKTKTLLLGHTGKIGCAINQTFPNLICKNSSDFNAKNFESIEAIIRKENPDTIINTVVYQGIDKCKENQITSTNINGIFPMKLASLCNEIDSTLVHFSTAAVFGNSNKLFSEDDDPSPINVYGETKLMGEENIKINHNKYYIIRLPFVFGNHPKQNQLLETLIFNDNDIKVANDIFTTPTYNIDIAKELKTVLTLDYGIYHITNTGKTSLYELIKELVKVFDIKKEVIIASYKDFKHIDNKNINTGLCTNKLKPMRHWKKAIKDFKNE